ncbi:MAG: YncE family protein [Acidobacteriaceae bacterium]|nr:YncE family protein [Acidobacteriaceae bacterium]
MKIDRLLASLFLLTVFAADLSFGQGYKKTGAIDIGGTGGWDYLTADSENHRLYVSHAGEVVVIDLKTEKPIGKISGMSRIHGIAIANDLNTGYISDGANNNMVFFDLKTLEVKKKVKAGTNPDGIVYDPASKRVFAFNGRSQNATAINGESGNVDGTIALGGKPEFPVSDGHGNVYDNIEDKSEIVQIESKNLQVKAHWPVAPCESPSGLAIDTANRRLFAVCDNKMMAVVDADTGKVLATPAIGDGPDAAGFDPGTKLAFSSNGDGTLTVVREKGKDEFDVVENAATAKGARTMALDTETHKIYLSSAEYGSAPAATAQNPHPRPAILPDTFKVLVLSR